MVSSWCDERIKFTGIGNLTVPFYTQKLMYESGCKIGSDCLWGKTRVWYEEKPPIIWVPSIDLADSDLNSIEESIEGKFMKIQNVRSISALHNTLN